MTSRLRTFWLLAVLAGLVTAGAVPNSRAFADDTLTRRVKSRVDPVYPVVARRMAISGTVKVAVIVAPNGTVKSMKVVGGHPLLVNAATDALRKWKFENATEETTGIVEFKFEPPQ